MNKNQNPETKNLKLTKNRHAILVTLDKFKSPVTAEDIFENLKQTGNKISLSTVYRALDFLSSNKVVKKSVLNNQTAVYEIDTLECTHHLICERCGKIVIINRCPINHTWKDVAAEFGFQMTRHKLEIYGNCSECK